MELHIATSKEAADYDYATFNGTRTLTLAAGKSSLVIKPGTIIGYRDGRNVVYVVTPDKGLNSEYKISEDDFDRKIAPKCDSATKAQARKAFSGKVEKPAATVAPKPIAKSPVKQSKALVPMPTASSIKFKCPGFNGVDSAKTVKTLNALLDRKSMAFAGVPISGLFSKPGGNFNLYGKTYFYGADGKTVYAFEGVDTENWKGFSVRISKIAPDVVKKLAKSSILEGRSATAPKVVSPVKVAPAKVEAPVAGEKDIKAMAKKLKLPGGAGVVVTDTSYTWNKKGGVADSVLIPLRDNLKANGFIETTANALGIHIAGSGSYFTDHQYVVYISAHMAANKADNLYLITLTVKNSQKSDAKKTIETSPNADIKAVKAIAKTLKLPGGSGAKIDEAGYYWRKKGGYADATFRAIYPALEANGFKKLKSSNDSSPDGSRTSSGSGFSNGKYLVIINSGYGVVKEDNWYSISLKPIVDKA